MIRDAVRRLLPSLPTIHTGPPALDRAVDRAAEPSVEPPAEAPDHPRLLDARRDVPTLRDRTLEDAFSSQGYCIVDLLSADEVATLMAACDEVHPVPNGAWACDFHGDDPATKRSVSDAIGAVLAPAIDAWFTDHESSLHSFVVNWPGHAGGLDLHEHSATVDERVHRSAVVWCALNDSTEANGTLHVVPASHRVQVGPKAERGPAWFAGHEQQLLDSHLRSITLRAGQALIFDNAVLHCSFPNTTEVGRKTVVATVAPRAAQLLYHEWTDEGTVRAYRLHPEFFFDSVSSAREWGEPTGLSVEHEIDLDQRQLTSSDIDALLPPGTCRHTHLDETRRRLRVGGVG